jgi:hypothetical protein
VYESSGARVELPVHADATTRLQQDDFSLGFRLEGAHPVPLSFEAGAHLARGAAPGGGDIVLRSRAGGIEDWVTVRNRAQVPEGLRYIVDVSSAAGLRLVSGVLELLDSRGTPRLRVGPAYVIDANGQRRPAELALDGCAADRSLEPPWGRPVVGPGSSECALRVLWDDSGLRYPLLVDPPWTSTGSLAVPRSGHTATRLVDGRVLVVGGASSIAELYDPGTNSWSTTGSLSTPRGAASAALLNSGMVLVSGGSASGSNLATAELYNPASGTFSKTGNMSTARSRHTASTLVDGRVLVAGGSTSSGATAACELYSPALGTFANADSLASARDDHAAATLANGSVLVVGTWGVPVPELFNPTAGTWSTVAGPGTLSLGLEDHTVTALKDGRALVVGGRTGGQLSTTDQVAIFSSATKTWTAGTTLPGPISKRRGHASALLLNDEVVAIGGNCDDSCDVLVNSHDFLDGAFWTSNAGGGSWTKTTGALSKIRIDATATTLLNGNVLVVQGADSEQLCLAQGCACTTGAECYTGNCVDGVCCDTACGGACNACSAALKGQGSDGACGPILAGTDPQSECAQEPETSCGRDGMCDGAGACRKHIAGTVCLAGSCIDTSSEVRPDTCDGSGACVDNQTGPCAAGYLCKGAGCKTSCADKTDCTVGYECLAGSCKKRPNGTACTSADECESAQCVDDVCCDSACDRQCEACAEIGSEGKCGPIAGEPRAGRAACPAGTAPCASSCNGTDPTACAFPGNETDCGFGKVCDGEGACVQPGSLCSDDALQSVASDGTVTDCQPYRCDSSTGLCGTSCTLSSDCAGTAFCRDKQCRTDSAAAEPDSGCSCSQRPLKPSRAPWLLVGLAGALLLRRRRPGLVVFVGFPLLLGCSEASDPPPAPNDGIELFPTAVAKRDVSAVLKQFGPAHTQSLRAAPSVAFRIDGSHATATVGAALRRAESAPARVLLPLRGDAALLISDESTGVSAAVALEGASNAPLSVTDSLASYPGAAPGGGDIVLRIDAGGVEDHVVVQQPGDASLRYRVALTGVAGLRLVENTLELLDPSGAPRLRVSPPYVVDANAERHPAKLGVTDCAVDTSPVVPFDRPPTAPGAKSCTLMVTWDRDLPHPVLVDPSWSTTAGPGVGHKTEHASAVMADGRLLIAGYGSKQAQVYSSGAWAVTGGMASSRTAPTATLLNTGLVLVAGGGTSSAERYNPVTGTFGPASTMSAARSGHRAVALLDNSVLVTGGDGSGSTQRYVPATNSWLTPPGNLGSARTGHASTLLGDGRVLVTGGTGSLPATSTRIFSLSGGWVAGPNMQHERAGHVAAWLSNGRVLVTGGEDIQNGPGAIALSERYNPATNAFSGAAPLPAAQRAAVGVPFGNRSKLYVIGGRGNGAGPVASTWIYTAATNSWANGSNMQRSRFLHTADLLPSGQILIVGGTSGAETLPPAEIQCVDFGCACTGSGVGSCLVGVCVDGVCCNTACTGKCQACSAAKKGGGANGVCGPVSDGADPDNECASQPASSCGTIGSCNGAGACRLHPAATECAAQSCTSSTIAQPAATCDGSGTCNVPGTVSCQTGYTCSTGACNTTCTTTAECDVGYVCAGNQCVKKANGETCTAGTECTTGFCVDGVCCDTACTGQCEACNQTGTPGLCVQVKGPPVGKPACSGAGVCAGVCSTNTQACTFPTATCGDGMACQNGECLQIDPICVDGGSASQSPAGVKTSCSPYLCNPTTGTCLTSCTVAAECAGSLVCNKNQCVDLGGGGGTGGSAGTAGAATGGSKAAATDEGGCGCRVPRRSRQDSNAFWLAGLALVFVCRRREAKNGR